MQKPRFVEDQVYHIYNRGVEKRKIFTDKSDHLRFIHDLFEFNDKDVVLNVQRRFNSKTMEVQPRSLQSERKPRKILVEILIFTLMPNHFHLLLKQKRENGIVKFMHKLGTGYTMYFNQKYERVGGLFQGRFKATLLSEEAHFIHLPFYIHSNPLSLINDGGSTSISWQEEVKFLKNYRWSSYLDYIGEKNFPSVTARDFLLDFYGGGKIYQKEFERWIKEKSENSEKIKEVIIDKE